jgi:glutamine amidotransferase
MAPMCRWITYLGEPIYLEDLIYKPGHSLIEQSLHAEQAKGPTNGDGFGIGWYGERDVPGVYREVLPAWNDPNLLSLSQQIRARLFFAHVRASTGTETIRPNCHPFAHGRWLFMHNGQIGGYAALRRRLEALIPDSYYACRRGTTDSEVIFYLLFANGLEHDPVGALKRTIEQIEAEVEASGSGGEFRLTAALSDGDRVYAIRYSTDCCPPSLYYTACSRQRIVVSEPLGLPDRRWDPVPPNHLLIVTGHREPEVVDLGQRIPRRAAAVA